MTGQDEEERLSGFLQLTRILAAIIAPTTLLTSLLYFFGWSHAYWFFDHFGVNSTVLGLTTGDYLIRSVDGLFVPLTVTALVVLFAIWGHTALGGSGSQVLGILVPVMTVVGILLTVTGLLSIFVRTWLSELLAAAPLCLAIGVVLLAYAHHLRGAQGTVWEWAVVFVLVGLSLFWAAGDYSAAVGTSRARRFVADLPSYPSVVIYSERSLSLNAPGVHEVRCADAKSAFRFRYDGLKLILRSGDQYVFVPQGWTTATGVAVVMPRSNSIRLEFVPNSARGYILSATC